MVVNLETVRHEQNRFATRQFFQTTDYISDGAQRADRKYIAPKFFEILIGLIDIGAAFSRCRWLDWREWGDAAAAQRIPLNPIDCRSELSLIRRKLLENSDAAAGAHDSDQVSRLHLLIDEFLQCLSHVVCALER